MKLFATIFLAIFVFHFVASAQSSKSDTTLISLDSLEMSSPESGIADPPADDLIRVIPPSPNSAAIEQYTSQPVSLYTGIPEISVPIYEIKQGSLSVPIRLNYHAGGIKVNQVASWVGLGWSLDAGGVISRTIYGLPDETFSPALSDVPSSFFDSSTGQPLNINSTNESDFAAWYRASLGELDMEYDRFTVSAPGLSSSLIINRFQNTTSNERSVHFIPMSAVKVKRHPIYNELLLSTLPASYIQHQWEIVDNFGNTYIFGKDGARSGIEDVIEASNCSVSASTGSSGGITAWHLMRIISADKKDEIIFEYETYQQEYLVPVIKSKVHSRSVLGYPSCNGVPSPLSFSNPITSCEIDANIRTVIGKRLSRITFRDGYVLFRQSNDSRLDLSGMSDLKSLEYVEVYNNSDEIIKKVKLDTDYFDSTPLSATPATTHTYKRLKLNSVSDVTNPCNPKGSYIFDYQSPSLPAINSYQQDWWGFYNGKINNDINRDHFLCPELTVTLDNNGWTNTFTFAGANRHVDTNYVANGVLNKIIYPTGGSVEYEYESHDFPFSDGSTDSSFDLLNTHTAVTPYMLTVLPGGAYLNFSNCSGSVDNVTCGIKITSNAPQTVNMNVTCGSYLYLKEGTYRVFFEPIAPYISVPSDAEMSVNLSYSDAKIKAGGIRVKKLTVKDGVNPDNNIVKHFRYTEDDGVHSSGVLHTNITVLQKPLYSLKERYLLSITLNHFLETEYICNCNKNQDLIRYPNAGIGYSKGVAVSYSRVEEFEFNSTINKPNGKIVKYFTNFSSAPSTMEPYVPNDDRDYRNGLETASYVYKYDTGFKLQKSTFNEYAFKEFGHPYLPSVKLWSSKVFQTVSADGSFCVPVAGGFSLNHGFWNIMKQDFYQTSEFFTLARTVERVYNQDNDAIYQETATNFYYENMNHLQLTRSVSKGDNDIDSVETSYRYPHDFVVPVTSTDPQALAIEKMLELNMTAIPIETYTRKRRLSMGLTSVVLNGKTNYFALKHTNGFDFPQRVKVRAFDATLYDAYNLAYFNGSGFFIDDSQYRDRAFFEYDETGNLIAQRKAEDIWSSFVYEGTNKSYPIAEAVNAEPDQVIHTSFEYLGVGMTTSFTAPEFAKTGNKALKSNVVATLYPSRPSVYLRQGYYWLSFWAKGDAGKLVLPGFNDGVPTESSGNWKFYRYKIVVSDGTFPNPEGLPEAKFGQFDILFKTPGIACLDELRVYPEMSLMNTLTHIPLVGISSSTDINHNTTYFEYDKYARLRLTRDFNRHILSRQKYIYGQTTVPCPDED